MEATTKKNYNRYGDGSIYQRKDGYFVAKYKPNNNAKPIIRYAKTEKGAKEKLKELKRLETLGVKNSNQKLDFLFMDWLVTFRKPALKPQSFDRVERMYLCHIQPSLGDYQIHQIDDTMLQRLIVQKGGELGHKTLSSLNGLLKSFFDYISRKKIIEDNPMLTVVMPKECHTVQKYNPIYFLELDEIARLEVAIETEITNAWKNDSWNSMVAKYGYIVLFMLNCGVRKGEMLGLAWSDLSESQKKISITKNLGLVKNRNQKASEPSNVWYMGSPKSKSSIREIAFNRKARYYMQELKRVHQHLGYKDKRHIARTPNGEPLSKSTWNRLMIQVCQLAQIDKPISPHELRHTFATVALRRGVEIMVVSKMLGHSSIEQTYKYVHLMKDISEQADDLLECLIP